MHNWHATRMVWRLAAMAVAGLLLLVSDAVACPTCKEALANSENAVNLVRGYGWSIIFMMSAPFLIFATLGGYFYLLVRQAQAARDRSGDALASRPADSLVLR